LEVVNTYNQGVIQWLHWSGPLEIKFAWIGPWTETSLTLLFYIILALPDKLRIVAITQQKIIAKAVFYQNIVKTPKYPW